MSAGSKVIVVRIPDALLAEMHECIDGRNERTASEPWDVSAFVRLVIREALDKRRRSRRPRRKREVK